MFSFLIRPCRKRSLYKRGIFPPKMEIVWRRITVPNLKSSKQSLETRYWEPKMSTKEKIKPSGKNAISFKIDLNEMIQKSKSLWVISDVLNLTLPGPRFFRYRKARGGGGCWILPPSLDSSENWYVEYSICTYAPLNFVENFFSFEVARPEKGLKILNFVHFVCRVVPGGPKNLKNRI